MIRGFLLIIVSPIRLLIFLYFKLYLISSRPILYLNLPDRLTLYESTGWVSRFLTSSKQSSNYFAILFLLRLIRDRHQLTNLIIEIPASFENVINWSQAFDILTELERIRDAGIQITAHSSGGGLKTLLLLSVVNRRFAGPSTNFITALPHNESYFFADLLKQIGINIEIYHAGKYKSAGESVSRRNSSLPARENLTSVLTQLKKFIINRFRLSTNLNKHQINRLEKLIQNQSISTVQDLFATGFIDQIIEIRQVKPFIAKDHFNTIDSKRNTNKKITDKSINKSNQEIIETKIKKIEFQILEPAQFIKRANRSRYQVLPLKKPPSIAIAVLQGTIIQGKQNDSAKAGNVAAYAWDSLFRELEDSSDSAVILYVDSPGGMSDASENLYQQIQNLSKKKPVIAYFASVAASGGYYLSCAANQIFASPVSLTGSIGVIRMRPQISDLLKKLHIFSERFTFDETTDILSTTSKPNPKSRKLLNESTQVTYNDFLSRVSEGRKLDINKVKKLAEGRVYLAEQLQGTGLIDDTTDFLQLIDKLKENLFGNKAKINIRLLPEIDFSLKELLSSGMPFSQATSLSYIFPVAQNLMDKLYTLKFNFPLYLSTLSFSSVLNTNDENLGRQLRSKLNHIKNKHQL